MTDITTNTPAEPKRQAVAIRDWITPEGKAVESGKENEASGFRYIHLATARRLDPAFNPETSTPHADSIFELHVGEPGTVATMLGIMGGLTLAGNVVNTDTKGPKGDPGADVISAIRERFAELEKGVWADRATGVGGVRYDAEKLAQAIANAKGETDPAPYAKKIAEIKVDAKTGASVAPDTKGAISYGSYALRNPKVKGEYEKLTGTGVNINTL